MAIKDPNETIQPETDPDSDPDRFRRPPNFNPFSRLPPAGGGGGGPKGPGFGGGGSGARPVSGGRKGRLPSSNNPVKKRKLPPSRAPGRNPGDQRWRTPKKKKKKGDLVPLPLPLFSGGSCSCPPGPAGSRGSQGPRGHRGFQGLSGRQGIRGIQGNQGIRGYQGIRGTQGIKGDQGDRGLRGYQGIQGIPGPKGDKGDRGDKGDPGDKGDTGAIGATGLTGSTGAVGQKGDPGRTGDTGLKGDTGLTGSTGDTGSPGLTGRPGPAGDTGPKGDSGSIDSVLTEIVNNINVVNNITEVTNVHPVTERLITETLLHTRDEIIRNQVVETRTEETTGDWIKPFLTPVYEEIGIGSPLFQGGGEGPNDSGMNEREVFEFIFQFIFGEPKNVKEANVQDEIYEILQASQFTIGAGVGMKGMLNVFNFVRMEGLKRGLTAISRSWTQILGFVRQAWGRIPKWNRKHKTPPTNPAPRGPRGGPVIYGIRFGPLGLIASLAGVVGPWIAGAVSDFVDNTDTVKWFVEQLIKRVDQNFTYSPWIVRNHYSTFTPRQTNHIHQQMRHTECPTKVLSTIRAGILKRDSLYPLSQGVDSECALKYLDILREEKVIP